MKAEDIVEFAVTPGGIIVVYSDPQIDPSTVVQHQVQISPSALAEEDMAKLNEMMETFHGWAEGALTRPPETGPYDNPEEVAQWGEDDG